MGPARGYGHYEDRAFETPFCRQFRGWTGPDENAGTGAIAALVVGVLASAGAETGGRGEIGGPVNPHAEACVSRILTAAGAKL